MVRTTAFQAVNRSPILRGATKIKNSQSVAIFYFVPSEVEEAKKIKISL